MAQVRIRGEDIAGIGLAVAAHFALVAWLVLMPRRDPPPPVAKMTVTLQGPVAAEAGLPSREQAAAAVAPQLADEPAPPVAEPVPVPAPPQPRIQPPPPRPAPRFQPAPAPAPIPRAQPPRPAPPRAQPPRPAPPATARPPSPRSRIDANFMPTAPKGATQPVRKPAGGSRIGADFVPGAASGSGKAATPPGPAITAQVRNSLAGEVSRQLKPKWQQPSGLEVEKLATTVEWDLNPDGTLNGAPRFVSQTGVTSANRPQSDRHREQAIRAVRTAAPFRLPPQFYAGWQHVRFTFDWKLN